MMADRRAVLEVLKYSDVSDILLHLSRISRLFTSQSNQPELWFELLGPKYNPSSPLSPKEQFRVISRRFIPALTETHLFKFSPFSLTWKSLPLYRRIRTDVSLVVTTAGDVFATGAHPQPDTYSISPLTGEVWKLSSLVHHRIRMGVILCEGNIYAFGGIIDKHQVSTSETYEFREKKWRMLPNSQGKRCSFSPTHYKGNIYLTGGLSQLCEYFQISTETYNLLPSNLDIYRSCIALFNGSELIVLDGGNTCVLDIENEAKCWKRVRFSRSFYYCNSQGIKGNEEYYFYSDSDKGVIALRLQDLGSTNYPIPNL